MLSASLAPLAATPPASLAASFAHWRTDYDHSLRVALAKGYEQLLAEKGTQESRERAAGALFELDEETRAAKTAQASDEPGASKPPPHIMVSYNWDHQHVILRVVAWLQAHGYLVWVDTEQMKGSTVDAMALAVEGSEVVLIGVSRAYKESSNCRMEAQYAFQKKKAIVPLKLTDGYEADGWLGLLLGTSMWYAFYGSTLPIDRVKTVMMTQDLLQPRFASPVDCARDIYLHQGLRGFYRASLPTLLRTACGQAVALTVYG